MQIDLIEPDLRLLRELVVGQRKSLLNEIAHTDDRAYRTELKTRYDGLDRIADAIDHAHAPVAAY
jgi:hypothetical protein